MSKRYVLANCASGVSLVDSTTGHVLYTLSPQFLDSIRFDAKLRNGELVPEWHGDTLIFVPPETIKNKQE